MRLSRGIKKKLTYLLIYDTYLLTSNSIIKFRLGFHKEKLPKTNKNMYMYFTSQKSSKNSMCFSSCVLGAVVAAEDNDRISWQTAVTRQPTVGARVVGGTDTKREKERERVSGHWRASHQSADNKRQTTELLSLTALSAQFCLPRWASATVVAEIKTK